MKELQTKRLELDQMRRNLARFKFRILVLPRYFQSWQLLECCHKISIYYDLGFINFQWGLLLLTGNIIGVNSVYFKINKVSF
mmetsp:Transcript_20216/g.40293  ORF Transcript_20216/g.40293 Transcript_20216/m.40293 type:complete len:82 (+) Transcript_20216:668-913(+)